MILNVSCARMSIYFAQCKGKLWWQLGKLKRSIKDRDILHALQALHEQMQSCEAGMKNLVMIQASLI